MTTVPGMAEESRPPLRRWLVGAGVLMALAAAAVFAGLPLPGAARDEAPAARAPAAPGRGLLDVLAPVVADGRVAAGAPPSALSEARAAAQVLAVAASAPAAATRREWGAVLARGDEGTVRRIGRAVRRAAAGGRRVPALLAVEPAAGAAQPELGVLEPPEVRRTFAEAGRAAARDGVDLVLAPSADLAVSGLPGELRAFGDDPARVTAQVEAAVAGWTAGGVLPVPGRFPGEGAAAQDPLAGPATIGLGLEELRARDLRPFAAVAGDVAAMQLSAALYAAFDAVTPATLLPDPVRLLRDRLGFAGVVVSADLGAAIPAPGGVGDAAVAALRAGCDLLLVPGGPAEQDAVARALTDAVGRGALGRGRLAAAAGRVLALKRAAGLDVTAAAP
jgi:beta-N-acetylhexosaminidase